MPAAILTPSQSRAAREELALSQGRIAADTRISRTYLSQFECDKLLFSDADLETLRVFYESRGVEFQDEAEDDPAIPGPNGPRIRDGFQIPGSVSREVADSLLDEIADNDKQARDLLQAHAPEGLFGIDDARACRMARNALYLMARNWMLLQYAQGRAIDSSAGGADSVGAVAMQDRELNGVLDIRVHRDSEVAD